MRSFIISGFLLLLPIYGYAHAQTPSVSSKAELALKLDNVLARQNEIIRQINEIAQRVQALKITVTARPR